MASHSLECGQPRGGPLRTTDRTVERRGVIVGSVPPSLPFVASFFLKANGNASSPGAKSPDTSCSAFRCVGRSQQILDGETHVSEACGPDQECGVGPDAEPTSSPAPRRSGE